jgi:hypothetical protein
MVSHAHGQGYAELYVVIAELIDDLSVLEGPYDPHQGDFAVAGRAGHHFGLHDREANGREVTVAMALASETGSGGPPDRLRHHDRLGRVARRGEEDPQAGLPARESAADRLVVALVRAGRLVRPHRTAHERAGVRETSDYRDVFGWTVMPRASLQWKPADGPEGTSSVPHAPRATT